MQTPSPMTDRRVVTSSIRPSRPSRCRPARAATPPSARRSRRPGWRLGLALLSLSAVALALLLLSVMPRAWAGAVGAPSPTAAPSAAVLSPATRVAALVQATPEPPPTPDSACPPPPGWVRYVVQAGDTLSELAADRETTVQALVAANCLTGLTIYVGQTLYLPDPHAPTPRPSPVALPATPPAAPLTAPTPSAQRPALPAGGSQRFDLPPEIINVILLGSDARAGETIGRTDTMILVSINTAAQTVRMLSIPRDLWVYIPGQGYDRINTAYVWGELGKYPGGGPGLVKATLEYNFGVPVHYYALVDLWGFIRIIDALGGVTIAVDCPFPDLELEPGIRHMNGQWALAYARSRISSSDYARSRRQQQVLRALWSQALRPETIPQIPILWTTFQGSIATDMGLEQIVPLAYLGTQIHTRQIISLYIDQRHVQNWTTPEGAQVELPRPGPMRAIFADLFAPTLQLDLIQAKVEIRNAGSTHFQATELAATHLYYLGFAHVQIGPQQPEVRPQTIIIDYTGNKEALALLREAFGVPEQNVWQQEQIPPPLDALVLLGQDFDPCEHQ